MNYRHAFHAGNFADVLKHAVLARILRHLCRKEAPWRFLDTHSGTGLYDLASDEALRTGEWRDGIGRIISGPPLDPVLADFLDPWLAAVRAANGGRDLLVYPGSPTIAAAIARPQDRLVFVELHPLDADDLSARFAHDRRVTVAREDGWIAVRGRLPPPERRGLVLIDPPFERPGEFDRIVRAFADARRRFATGIVAAWYPIKDPDTVAVAKQALVSAGHPRLLAIEQWVRDPRGDGPLSGAGLVIANAPWRLAEDCEAALPALTERLSSGAGSGFRVERLSGDTPSAAA
jgi:23S rRNA (adenine2030-N6)-methyltransferase